jgi:hypothetical protein
VPLGNPSTRFFLGKLCTSSATFGCVINLKG